jgi:hypothetical protein
MENAGITSQDRLFTLGYALGLSLVAIFVAYLFGFFRLSADRLRPKPPIFFRDVLGVFLLFITVEILLVPLGAYLWFAWDSGTFFKEHFFLTPSQQGWLNVIAIFTTGVCLFAFLIGIGKPIFQSAGLTTCSAKETLQSMSIGSSTWLICYPIVATVDNALALLITWLVPFPPAEQVAVQHLKMSMNDPWLFTTMVFLIIVLVPIIEEVLFRGFFQGWLRNYLGPKGAIASASLFFTLFHYSDSQGIGNIELLCSLFVLSCFLGFLYERQGCLWASIALHTTFNALSVGMILLNMN